MSKAIAQDILKRAIETGPMIGAAAAVCRDGGVTLELAEGLASQASGTKAGANTLFDADTLTQSIVTSIIFMSIAESAKINLNTPAAHFWPDFAEEGKEKVTLRHLLKHTSGLAADRPYIAELLEKHPDWIGTDRAREFILGRVAEERLEYPPTYTLIPSNLGYIALGFIAEKIGAASLPALFEKLISCPLGLTNAFLNVPAEKKGACATTTLCPRRKKVLQGEPMDANAWAMGGAGGHAGLFITASDAARIGGALIASLSTQGNFLPQMKVDEFIGPKAKYKLGWETPGYNDPLCGAQFSKNTVGHAAKVGSSLWIDLERGFSAALFCVFDPALAASGPAIAQFKSLSAPLHDALTL